MVNELTCKVRATLMGAKKGKTSAYAHAGKLISDINFFGNTEVQASYNGRHKLDPILTIEELLQLSTCGENI